MSSYDSRAGGRPSSQHREGGTFGSLSDALASTRAYLSPFAGSSGRDGAQSEPSRLLSDVAPHIMRPRIFHAAVQAGSSVASGVSSSALVGAGGVRAHGRFSAPGFALSASSPARSLARLGAAIQAGPVTSTELRALEASDAILASASSTDGAEDLAPPSGIAADVSLFRGFQATIPSASEGRDRRRKARGRDAPNMGLKQMGNAARGLLVDGSADDSFKGKDARKARRSDATKGKDVPLGMDELQSQLDEIVVERENLNIRRMLVNADVAEVVAKIAALEKVKADLSKSLLGIKEEELELNDEYDGISELLQLQKHRNAMPGGVAVQASNSTATAAGVSSRRRKGPLFLPSEHDDLPSGVVFMTLSNHTAPITSLDFSEPYGTLVSSAQDDSVRVWDLASGDEVGRLRGHAGMVKCLQVEDELCITGGADHTLRLWDLRRVENFETRLSLRASKEIPENLDDFDGDGDGAIRSSKKKEDEHDPCLRVLEGHSKAITSLYFDDSCLVTGASDKTLRQWDLNTGQCVLTMDILWALSNPTSTQSLASSSYPSSSMRDSMMGSGFLGSSGATSASSFMADPSGQFSYPTPPYADGSWEMYQDYVGGVQFWGYALASGSGDGGVRMWDMRTGQAHRTLLGHTAPVTCLQFDEIHVISGSLDKSIRIWDLRTGAISDTIKYDFPVTALQFDTRKIMAATGQNQVEVYNRTTLQHQSLSLNGHTGPVEKLRYMDRYAVTGAKDNLLKVWAL